MKPFRIGYGFDLHRWETGRRLILGGVEIQHDHGLAGHSDADALTHALIDALLGALALGDIGQHFPDSDPRFKDYDSQKMLKTVMVLIHDAGYEVGNVDCTLVADQPKMAPYIKKMRRTLAKTMDTTEKDVSIKATRTENVLFPPQDGLLAIASVLLFSSSFE